MDKNARCFLCDAPEDLVYAETPSGIALCGLGPLAPGYSVVASRDHIASAADAASKVPEYISFAESVRASLAKEYGSCLLTEHGRMATCVGASGKADPHCFHAHFLLFPGAPAIIQEARSFFARDARSNSLQDALNGVNGEGEYFLVSPTEAEVSVLTRPGRMIPQFARMLVANAMGVPQLANWRKEPGRDKAAANAALLRSRVALTLQ